MEWRIERRSVLGAVGAAVSAGGSGCLLFGWDDPSLEELAVTAENNTDEHHTFGITLLDGAESIVFEETFSVDAGAKQSRATDLTGTEYRVLVDVDGRRELEDTWHWAGCRTDEVRVTFWSATEGNAEGVCTND